MVGRDKTEDFPFPFVTRIVLGQRKLLANEEEVANFPSIILFDFLGSVIPSTIYCMQSAWVVPDYVSFFSGLTTTTSNFH